MAAEDLVRGRLPPPWSYGVTVDGKIFFINDGTNSTTWLHPVSMMPVQSGFTTLQDLPKGWERGLTPDGALYYVNHHTRTSTFRHPVTGELDAVDPGIEKQHEAHLASSISPTSNEVPPSPQVSIRSQQSTDSTSPSRKKSHRKSTSSLKITEKIAAKRTEQSPISMKGWLFKQDSSGLKQWKRRWFVLSDFCLFYYKGEQEGQNLGSILLPSYKINPCASKEGVLKKHSFKAEHQNMRTYYFAADNDEERKQWMNAMSLATILQRDPKVEEHYNSPRNSLQRERPSQSDIEAGFKPVHPPKQYGSLPTYSHHSDVPSSRTSLSSEQFRGDSYPTRQYDRTMPQYHSKNRLSNNSVYMTKDQMSGDYRGPISDHNRGPTNDHYRGPVHDHNRGPTHDSNKGPVYDPNRGQVHDPNRSQGHDPNRGQVYDRNRGPVHDHSRGPTPISNTSGTRPVKTDHNSNEYPKRMAQDDANHARGRPQDRQDRRHPRARREDIKHHPRAQSLDRRQFESRQTYPEKFPEEFHGLRSLRDEANRQEVTRNGYHGDSGGHTYQNVYSPNEPWSQDLAFPTSQGAPKQFNVSPNSFEPLRVQVAPEMQTDAAQNERTYDNTPEDKRQESLQRLKDWQNEHISAKPSQQGFAQQSPSARKNLSQSLNETPPPNRPPLPLAYSDSSPIHPEVVQPVRNIPNQSSNRYQQGTYEQNGRRSRQESGEKVRRSSHDRPHSGDNVRHDREDGYWKNKENNRRNTAGQRRDNKNKMNNGRLKREISTVKEDPDMPDAEIMKTDLQKLKRHFAMNGKVRLSLSAEDLLGRSHEELVLLLIDLRRKQSRLQTASDFYKRQLEIGRQNEKNYHKMKMEAGGRRLHERVEYDHDVYMDLSKQNEDVTNQLDVHKPLVNLVDNLVKMGSLYGGDNNMYASQYKKHLLSPDQLTPPRKLLEFSRRLQEEKISESNEQKIRNLTQDEVNLEEKLQRLYELDSALQEKSFLVSSLQEDKVMLETALTGVKKQVETYRHDLRESERLLQQQKTIESELTKVRQELADNSLHLEETTTENAKVEHEVQLLRSKVMGTKQKSQSTPNLGSNNTIAKQKLEKDLVKVKQIMNGLNEQGKKLSQAMNSLRSSNPNIAESQSPTYRETDLDSMVSKNLALSQDESSDKIFESDSTDVSPFDITEADENTKKFFGILPRDRPRVKTVRDVKSRQTERRSRKDSRDHYDPSDYDRITPSYDEGTFTAPRRSQSLPRRLDCPSNTESIIPNKRPNVSKEPRQSAAERLFPANLVNGHATAPANSLTSSTNTLRRTSDLYTPKPFSVSSSNVVTSVKPFTPIDSNKSEGSSQKKKGRSASAAGRRRGPRYLTISSSRPVKFETSPVKRKGIQTAAGDLISKQWPYHNPNADVAPDYVKSPTKEDRFDEWTIDRELFLPQKVVIPERYIPENEELTEEEKMERARKAERIRKMLSSHSLQDFTNDMAEKPQELVHQEFKKEKQQREHLLSLNQALAKEVTLRSKQVAGDWSQRSSLAVP